MFPHAPFKRSYVCSLRDLRVVVLSFIREIRAFGEAKPVPKISVSSAFVCVGLRLTKFAIRNLTLCPTCPELVEGCSMFTP